MIQCDPSELEAEIVNLTRPRQLVSLSGRTLLPVHWWNRVRFTVVITPRGAETSNEVDAILQDGVLELHVPKKMPVNENGKSNIIAEEPNYEHTAC
jgi:hypothetical protein